MSMTGAIVNALAIVAGGAVGLLFRRGIPERVSKTVMIGLGLCVLYIGISGAMECRSILIVIVSMSLGAAVGALLNIDGAIHRLGTWVEAHVHRHEGGPSLAEGFVTASLLCCIGAMAVNGSLDAGIRGDNSIHARYMVVGAQPEPEETMALHLSPDEQRLVAQALAEQRIRLGPQAEGEEKLLRRMVGNVTEYMDAAGLSDRLTESDRALLAQHDGVQEAAPVMGGMQL